MGDYFKFDLLPTDLKTQVFSFVRFADWVLLLSKVCSEWRHLCKTTTLPKVLDVREILPPHYQTLHGSKDVVDNLLKLAQQFNTAGLVLDAQFDFKSLKKISKALPKLQWLQFIPQRGYRTQITDDITPLSNSITHLDVTMIGVPMPFNELPPCFPNLQVLNYSTRVRLNTLQKMEHKFDKVKVIRTGININVPLGKKKRQIKKRRTAGENVGQLIEFVEAFKKVAPALTELYMFWEYKRDSKPAELKREFEAVEEAAASMGIKLYCRDLVRLLKPQTVQDPDAEFFLACYAHNNLPYRAYTINGYTLLQHAIAAVNVKVVRALFDHKLTNMDYELSVRNESNKVSPTQPGMTDSGEAHRLTISNLIPYNNSEKCLEIVDILLENGYDVSKIIRLPEQKVFSTPLWSRLKFTMPSVRRLFENYTAPIRWFDRTKGGETIAHKLVIIRGTPVYLDLMEKQLSKEQISELMSMQDDKGNTPVHLLGESSVLIFDRVIPYIKNCWTIKNKRNQTPFGVYINRYKESHISLKEEKLRRFFQEMPIIEDNDVYEFFRVCDEGDLNILPLLAEKGANLTAKGEAGIGFFFSSFTIETLQAFKRLGVDLTITDDNGSNLLHGIFMEKDRRELANVPALIEFLVKEGVNINQVNKNGITPLLKSMQKLTFRGLEAVAALLKNGADPNLHGPNTPSPLITVLGKNTSYSFSKKNKMDYVKLLLSHGAKPTSIRISGDRFCPLAMAITNDASVQLIRMLMDHGADIKERDDVGNSLLHQTSNCPIGELPDKKIFGVIDFLLTYIDIDDQNALGKTILHQMLEFTEFAEYLVSKGANINIKDNQGDTPLLLALDSVDMLLNSPKLDWLAINRQNKSALHILVRSYEERLEPFMKKFNAMPIEQQNAIKKVFSASDGVHPTALHGAVLMLQFESVKICVEVFGLSPAMQHQSLLLYTHRFDNQTELPIVKQIVAYLLEHGANINAQDKKGNTALHYALMDGDYCSLDFIRFLLDNGADPTIKNNVGQSVRDFMPSIGTLSSSASRFNSELPISVEDEAEKLRKKKAQDEILKHDEDEPHYDEEEIDDMFNSDDMDENDVDADLGMEDVHFYEEEEEDDEDNDIEDMRGDEDEGEEDDDDDDEDDEGRLRRHPGGFVFRL